MDSDIGNFEKKGRAENSLFCVRFRTLRYSKLPKIC